MHTFTIITEAHLGLAETNCVFAFTHAIELLELSLVDTLHTRLVYRPKWEAFKSGLKLETYLAREVDLNGLDTNVLGTGRHGDDVQ